MIKKDIRIYIYEAGVLKKPWYKKMHRQTSFDNAKNMIKIMCNKNPNIFKDKQFVITEYTDIYTSKIIGII